MKLRCNHLNSDQSLGTYLGNRSRNGSSRTSPKRSEKNKISKNKWDIDTRIIFALPMSLAFLLYLNTLKAGFVYDDHRAISGNPDVIGTTPLSSLWKHDFWGADLGRKGSHGSWRPLTTLTFRLNGILAGRRKPSDISQELESYELPNCEAWHFHAVNIVLHAIVTGAYAGLLLTVGIEKLECLLASLLFAVHPVHVEAVSGLVGRAELLAGLSFCLALGSYFLFIQEHSYGIAIKSSRCICVSDRISEATIGSADPKASFWLLLSGALTALGLMCKEQAFTALTVGFIIHVAAIVAYSHKQNLFKQILADTWPVCSMMAALLFWRLYFFSSTPSFSLADNPAAHSSSLPTKILTLLRYWSEDMRLLLFPNILSFDWSMNAVPLITSVLDSQNIYSVVMLTGLTAVALSSFKLLLEEREMRINRTPLHNACYDIINNNNQQEGSTTYTSKALLEITSLAMLVIPFLPASNIFAWVGFIVAERVLYIPSMGYALIVAHGAQIAASRGTEFVTFHRKSWRNVIHGTNIVTISSIFAWLIVIGTMSARTFTRNTEWESDERLFRSGIPTSPAKAYANLGVVYSDQGRFEEAKTAYSEALKLAPNMAETHYNLGILFETSNQLEEAAASYERALQRRTWFVQAHLALASTLFKAGRSMQACQALRNCIDNEYGPSKDGKSHAWTVVACRQRLVRAYLSQDKAHQAYYELQKTLSSLPIGYPLHSILTLQAEVYASSGDHAEAEETLIKVLQSQPTHIPAHLAYSKLLQANNSKADEAELWLRKASLLEPSDPHILQHLGQLLLEQGRAKEAVEPWLKAAQIDPQDHTSAFNAATSLRLAGRNEQAEVFYRKAVELHPKDIASQRNLGAILHLNGKFRDAQHHYHIALGLSPGDPQTTTNLQRLAAVLKKNPL